jgi:hypothetical protein
MQASLSINIFEYINLVPYNLGYVSNFYWSNLLINNSIDILP